MRKLTLVLILAALLAGCSSGQTTVIVVTATPESAMDEAVVAQTATVTPKPSRTPIATIVFSPREKFGAYTSLDCRNLWQQATVDVDDDVLLIDLILNRNWAPDSVGAGIKECIEEGWVGWR